MDNAMSPCGHPEREKQKAVLTVSERSSWPAGLLPMGWSERLWVKELWGESRPCFSGLAVKSSVGEGHVCMHTQAPAGTHTRLHMHACTIHLPPLAPGSEQPR